jgi:LmbE family N-acetylglucosaminyl deacetylase
MSGAQKFMAALHPKPALRRLLVALNRRVLRARSRPFPVEAGATTLVIAPHPDDETLGCGGVIPLLLGAGHAVHVTYVTDGSGSHSGHPDLARRRRAEAQAAAAVLGVSAAHLEFLDAPDGSLARLSDQNAAALVARLGAALTRLNPTLVLLPCRFDGSSEHEAAFALFARACDATGRRPRVLEFPIWSWWNPRHRPGRNRRQVWRASFPGGAARKQAALAAHATQVRPIAPGAAPVLTPAFIAFFATDEEFFFEQ